MRKENRNKKRAQSDFIRYRNNEMSGRERNAFEKELQRDPFAEEAADGLSTVSADEASSDIRVLKKAIRVRTGMNRHIYFYRAAAVLAVLIAVSSLYLLIKPGEKSVRISENLQKEVQEHGPLTVPQPEKITSPAGGAATEYKKVSPETSVKTEVKTEKKDNSVSNTDKREDVPASITEEQVSAMAQVSGKAAAEEEKDTGQKPASDRAAPVSIKNIKAAGEYYHPPEPVGGREAFDKYLENNIINPEPNSNIRQRVSLIFLVRKDSSLSHVRIISSPGENYSREAVRLVTGGPKWKPALKNNLISEDSARVDIIFR